MLKKAFTIGLTITVLLTSAGLPLVVPLAQATDTSANAFLDNQNYNQLISDGNFVDINSMSEDAVQSFLVSQGSDLATIDSGLLGSGASGRRAAKIIWDAAHANDSASSGCAQSICLNSGTGTISPRAILILLQKEQSLISGWHYDSSKPNQLNAATGYGCPDSGGCNATYAGFTNQVGWASWQLRWNYEMSKAGKSGVSPYLVGNVLSNMSYNNVGSPPRSGSVSVLLSNNATASLYRYTPHLFFGNYNFWKLGITWFGFSGSSTGTDVSANDTAGLQAGTYNSSFTASGTKTSDTHVVFNGQTIANSGSTTWKVTISPGVGSNNYTLSYLNSDNSVAATKTITIERRKLGDINGDAKVDILDLSTLSTSYGLTVPDGDWRDLNPDVDNVIDLLDLSLLANNWEG